MTWRSRLLIAAVLLLPFAIPALADLNYTQGSGTVIFDFVCFTTKHCPAHVNTNSAGTEIMTASNPAQVSLANTGANATAIKVDGSGVTQPVSGTVTANLGTLNGAATAANQPSNSAIGGTTAGQTGNLSMGAVTTGAPTYTTAQTNPLSLTTAGALRVDASATTQPVSGTVTANQGGTWNINNISGTVSLPTGASTAAKQPALGTAGTASTDVLTVQGIAAMTPLLATLSGTNNINNISGTVSLPTGAATSANQPTNAAQGSTTSGQTGNLVQGAVTTAAPTYTTAQTSPLSLTTAGALRTDASATTQPVSAASLPLPTGAATSANQTNASQKTQIVDGLGNVIASTSNNLNVQCANCSGSGASAADAATFTAGTSVFAPSGGEFTTGGATACVTGHQCLSAITADRALFTNLADIAGAAPSATNPLWMAGNQPTSVTMQNAAVANGNGTTLTVTGLQTALVNVNCSVACSGGTTINFEGTDSTGTFFSLAAFPVVGTSTAVSSATTSGQFWIPVSGLTTIRARISAYSAGTITVTGTPVFGVNATVAQVANTNANGQATMANSSPVVIASNQSALTVNNATAANLNAAVVGTGTAGSPAGNILTVQGVASMTALAGNTTQLAGNAISTGNGTQGTGTARVAIASDNSAVAGLGAGATGSAAPANAIYQGTLQGDGTTGGHLKGIIQCDSVATYDASTTGSTQMVALASGQTIYVCGYAITTGGTATNVKLVYGTGSNCATGSTNLTPAYQLVANGGIVDRAPFWGGMKTASANALCVNASAANAVQATVYYAQF